MNLVVSTKKIVSIKLRSVFFFFFYGGGRQGPDGLSLNQILIESKWVLCQNIRAMCEVLVSMCNRGINSRTLPFHT